ncbi:YwbE family protein [Deinococcus rubellus]|uniref:YwbE family protein n=1 Tax=Deinococcus rubellus TaxID=1889240 RepID=A0ABY5YMN3_9DEIO|nr:YwbE family protein [Deinococcus rubellus]UWX65376.1 YwbE family protein [Deinococcus rubellus]
MTPPPPRSQVRPGLTVDVIQKHHQASGQLTRGVVSALLTSSATHPHGIKVRLTSGVVGRVQALVTPEN